MNKKDRVGEISYNTQGLKMEIIKYDSYKKVYVKFEDGSIRTTKYEIFKKGSLRHPNDRNEFKDKTGEENLNNFGSKIIIIKYNNARDIDVYFPKYNWTFKHTRYDKFKNGNIACPYESRVYGIGYLGEGKYSKDIKKYRKIYDKWHGMMTRCYSEKYQKDNPTYKNCKVCDKWLCFQNFAEWYTRHYYEIPGEVMHLDKDILIHGNKIYSPETCLIVPDVINLLFVKSDKTRGNTLIGTSELKENRVKSFMGSCSYNNKSCNEYFKYEHNAFLWYKLNKELVIQSIANEYKQYLPKEVYNALYNYEVEIDD